MPLTKKPNCVLLVTDCWPVRLTAEFSPALPSFVACKNLSSTISTCAEWVVESLFICCCLAAVFAQVEVL